MTVVTRRLEIDAGHRLQRHESKCRNLHGHRYAFEVSMRTPKLDQIGRVIDFGRVKDLLGGWLDTNWDHGFIVEHSDPLAEWLAEHQMKHFILPVPPTAENLARDFYIRTASLLPAGVEVTRVRVYETPNCWADFSVTT